LRQRVRVHPVVVDEVLVQLVGRQEPQLALRALAHALTLALLALATLGAAAPAGAQARDPLRDQLWHLDRVHAEDAWPVSRGAGMVLAVVDTGVDASHPDLAGNVGRGIDLVEEGTPPDDPNGHGTLVAGVIAAVQGNGLGVAGASPDVRIMPVRVLDKDGNGNSELVARGVRWAADNGAHVINLSLAEVPGLLSSLGGLFGDELSDAIRYADERGAVVVAAAGNDGRSSTPYPRDLPLLVVGATDRGDQVWSSSNRDARTVFAPGVEIVSTWRDHGYGRANGTSFATPIVSALAAILRQRGLTASEARAQIEATATRVGTGRGRVDFARAVGVEPAQSPSPAATAGPPGGQPTASPGATLEATPPPRDSQPPGADGQAQPPPPRTAPPEVVSPLPEGAGDPVAGPDVDPDVQVRPGLEVRQSREPLRWLGLVALLGVVAAFARAARRR